jgi:hypothetical protein
MLWRRCMISPSTLFWTILYRFAASVVDGGPQTPGSMPSVVQQSVELVNSSDASHHCNIAVHLLLTSHPPRNPGTTIDVTTGYFVAQRLPATGIPSSKLSAKIQQSCGIHLTIYLNAPVSTVLAESRPMTSPTSSVTKLRKFGSLLRVLHSLVSGHWT